MAKNDSKTDQTVTKNTQAVDDAINAPKQANHYVNNGELLKEILASQENLKKYPPEDRVKMSPVCMTPRLVELLQTLVYNISMNFNWRGYSFIDDMRTDAMVKLTQAALKFDINKAGDYPNPFAYMTQTINRVFIHSVKLEKRETKIKDAIIEMNPDINMQPSMGRQLEGIDDEASHDLDGTKNIPSSHYIRRRKKKKILDPAEDMSKMDDVQMQEFLDRKKAEFYAKQKIKKEVDEPE